VVRSSSVSFEKCKWWHHARNSSVVNIGALPLLASSWEPYLVLMKSIVEMSERCDLFVPISWQKCQISCHGQQEKRHEEGRRERKWTGKNVSPCYMAQTVPLQVDVSREKTPYYVANTTFLWICPTLSEACLLFSIYGSFYMNKPALVEGSYEDGSEANACSPRRIRSNRHGDN